MSVAWSHTRLAYLRTTWILFHSEDCHTLSPYAETHTHIYIGNKKNIRLEEGTGGVGGIEWDIKTTEAAAGG